MVKKYKMEEIGDSGFFRIIALKDFRDVKAGDLGGLIEFEHNLSQEGDCWVYLSAIARGNAVVKDNAVLLGFSIIKDNAMAGENAIIKDCASIEDKATISGCAEVGGYAEVSGHSVICENAKISGDCEISERAYISGNAIVTDNAVISGNAEVFGNAKVYYDQQVVYGKLDKDVFATKDWAQAIYNLYGILPVNNKVILYKYLNKYFTFSYDNSFKYPKKGEVSVDEYDTSIQASCASGLHFADPCYWSGDVLIAAEIDLNDIITVQEGKVRVKKANILGEVKL